MDIKEGIAHIIAAACYHYYDERRKAETQEGYFSNFNAMNYGDESIKYLTSRGIVQKVEVQELPENPYISPIPWEGPSDENLIYKQAINDMLKAGYVKVVPLASVKELGEQPRETNEGMGKFYSGPYGGLPSDWRSRIIQ